jgi:hypothetical protein
MGRKNFGRGPARQLPLPDAYQEIGAPKSEAGHQTVPLTTKLVSVLRCVSIVWSGVVCPSNFRFFVQILFTPFSPQRSISYAVVRLSDFRFDP